MSLAFCRPILRGVFGQIDDDVMRYAQQYFIVSAISYPFIGAYNAGAALFRAQGNSRISMLASLVMNVINICGNALLIYGFGMGVLGAALATLVGRIFAAVWVFRQQQQFENPLRIGSLAEMRPEKEMILRILNIGIPSGLENGMFQIGKLCVSSLTSTLGTSAIAANAVANSITSLATITQRSTVSLAMIPVVGRCLGAGEKKQAKRYALLLLGVAVAGMAVTNITLFLTAPLMCRLYNLSAVVHRHVRAGAALVRRAQHLFLVHQLYAAQRPARGRRRQIHNDRQHHQHVAVPRAAVLLFRRPPGLWACWACGWACSLTGSAAASCLASALRAAAGWSTR